MSDSEEQREQALSQALRQVASDYQAGRLSMRAYRQLRRTVIEASEGGKDIRPLLGGDIPDSARPGPVVWAAVGLIVALLALLAWLLR